MLDFLVIMPTQCSVLLSVHYLQFPTNAKTVNEMVPNVILICENHDSPGTIRSTIDSQQYIAVVVVLTRQTSTKTIVIRLDLLIHGSKHILRSV